MSEKSLAIISDSIQDFAEYVERYFSNGDMDMVAFVLLKANRLHYKLEQMLVEAIYKPGGSSASIARPRTDLKQRLCLWHDRLAQFFDQQGEYEKAEREWLAALTHMTEEKAADLYIQYAHSVLMAQRIRMERTIEENLSEVTPFTARSVMTALRKAKTAVKYAIAEQGETDATRFLLDRIELIEQEFEQNEKLQQALNEDPSGETPEQVLAELESMIGLVSVKRKVREISDWVVFNRLRQEQGYKSDELSLHMVFSGNPGTGKTTIARLVARILKVLGVLSKGHLVEVDRSDLVAEYVGQTAVKTMGKIKEAIGGILFIDEAYSLTRSLSNDFGIEAIDTLVKAMEDQRKNLVVIFAGYPAEMDTFLRSNPGLQSRIQNQIGFPDYSLDEMMSITTLMLKQKQYRMKDKAALLFRDLVHSEMMEHPSTHGNGRLVRNLIEDAVMNKATLAIEQKERSETGPVDLDTIDETVMRMVQAGHNPEQNNKGIRII